MRTHQQIDRLNLELGRAVAEKLRRHPDLFDKIVAKRLQHWRASVEGGDLSSAPYLKHWQALVERGLEACLAKITEDSERAAALRQASPFAGVLNAAERMRVIRAWRAKE